MGCTVSKTAAAAPAQKIEGDFKITLQRTSDKQALGVTFVDLDVAAGLLGVEALKEEGLLPEYIKAKENAPEQQLKVGDRIIAVNAVSGNLTKMKAELKQKTLVLVVQRAPVEPALAVEPAVTEPAAEPETVPVPETAATEAAATDLTLEQPAAQVNDVVEGEEEIIVEEADEEPLSTTRASECSCKFFNKQ